MGGRGLQRRGVVTPSDADIEPGLDASPTRTPAKPACQRTRSKTQKVVAPREGDIKHREGEGIKKKTAPEDPETTSPGETTIRVQDQAKPLMRHEQTGTKPEPTNPQKGPLEQIERAEGRCGDQRRDRFPQNHVRHWPQGCTSLNDSAGAVPRRKPRAGLGGHNMTREAEARK